ncbi:hypothetical protein J4558_21650 [Leptolyngbya sp. 15MV]|nr:hypothetical protein J4558_21650 [Leptolyngbya sp. 15MV]
MLRRIRSIAGSRASRKFFRSRLAVLASVVIAFYAAVGLLVMGMDAANALGKRTGWWDLSRAPLLHLLTVEKTMSVVGSIEQPGLGVTPSPEVRVRSSVVRLEAVEQAFRLRARPGEDRDTRIRGALANIRVGDRRVVDLPLEDLRARVAEARAIYSELDDIEDLDQVPDALPKVERLERLTLEIYTTPTGSAALAERIALSLAIVGRRSEKLRYHALPAWGLEPGEVDHGV